MTTLYSSGWFNKIWATGSREASRERLIGKRQSVYESPHAGSETIASGSRIGGQRERALPDPTPSYRNRANKIYFKRPKISVRRNIIDTRDACVFCYLREKRLVLSTYLTSAFQDRFDFEKIWRGGGQGRLTTRSFSHIVNRNDMQNSNLFVAIITSDL